MSALGQEEQHEHNLFKRNFTQTLAKGMPELCPSIDYLHRLGRCLWLQWMLQIKRYG